MATGRLTTTCFATVRNGEGALPRGGTELYPRCRKRIVRLKAHASDIGWGHADYLHQEVRFLEDELSRFTNYDGLLLSGHDRHQARGMVRAAVEERLSNQRGER